MSLIEQITVWYSAHMNYASITALMTVESSFIPFPSEVVIPPAVYVAGDQASTLCATGTYPVDVLIIVLFGTLGAVIGAVINYALSVWLGRPIIYKFADSKLGHLCLLSSEKIQRAEEYFREKGNMSTFIGRFIPGIRQLISIPAGLSRMHFGAFLWWTFLGAFVWNCVLALLGYIAHGQMDLINKYSHELSVAILVLLAAAILYFVGKKFIFSAKR
ncbi:MAG: DedA family protein [Paludibacteraceae bacterium]|nr:DedA family protein [Paludibacteraceae bacterium]MBQ4391374.1 DedA family protein [Paludibacteraceae bacterium]